LREQVVQNAHVDPNWSTATDSTDALLGAIVEIPVVPSFAGWVSFVTVGMSVHGSSQEI
jgi:hypothetical protein